MDTIGRWELEDELAAHWTSAKATEDEVRAEVLEDTGRAVPPGAEDCLAHLTDEEVARVHAKRVTAP